MTTDDDMREIEAALTEHEDRIDELACGERVRYPSKSKEALLALIRQKLEGNVAQKPATSAQPAGDVAQNDAEHERDRRPGTD